MRISSKGIDLIKSFEGLRLEAYLDSVDVPTIGYGHTRKVQLGQTITAEQAESFLMEDIHEFELAIQRLVYVPLSQNQFDAIVSFTFNVGIGNLKRSTLLKKLNAGNIAGAANEFNKWVYAGKEKLKGLVKRRDKERLLFIS